MTTITLTPRQLRAMLADAFAEGADWLATHLPSGSLPKPVTESQQYQKDLEAYVENEMRLILYNE